MEINKKILIVEDEAIIALDLSSSLEKLGYNVSDHVTKGEDVIKSITNNKPDLILMDVNLEGDIDGVETAQMVHDNFNIPVIFITSYSNKNIIERAKKTNPFGYIVKPFEDRELFTNIEIAFFKHDVEFKLKESEKKYRELSESIQQIIFECNLDGFLTYINEPGIQMLGITPQDLENGIFINDFISNENFEIIKTRHNNSTVQNSTNNAREHLLINKFGKHLYIEEYTSPIYKEDKLIGLRGIFIDITSKKLKENLSSFYAKIMFLFKDIDTEPQEIIEYILTEFGNILPYIESFYFNELDTKNNLLTKRCDAKAISNRTYSKGLSEYVIENQVSLFLRGDELLEFNKKYKRITFGEKAIFWCGFPIRYANNKIGVFAIQSHKNISLFTYSVYEILKDFFQNIQSFFDRLSYLIQLKRSEEKYKYLINSISEGVVQMDLKFNILFVNNQLCDLLELSAEELIFNNIFDTFTTDAKNKELIENIIIDKKGSLNNQFQLQIISKSGKVKEIVLNILPVLNKSSKLVGLLGTILNITERKNHLKLIDDSEQKFKAIFDQAAVGVAIVNSKTGEILNVNKKYCEIFEYSRKELLEMNSKEYTYSEDLKIDLLYMDNLIKGKITEFTIEKRYLKKNKEVVWVNLTVSPLWKVGEDPTNHISIIENIDDRKTTEQALKRIEEEKENILKSIPDSFVVISNKGKIINSYFKSNEIIIIKDNYKKLSDEKINDAFIDEALNAITKGIDSTFKKNELLITELEIKLGSQVYYFEIRFVPINSRKMLLIIRDIADLKKSTLEIQKLFNITEQTKELIVITDAEGNIEYVNPMFMKTTGYDFNDVKGKKPSVFKSNVHSISFFSQLWQTINSGKPYKMEVTNSKKNGELYIEEKMITPILNARGEITNFISTGRDITEEKKRERKILTYQKFEKIIEKREQKERTLSLIQGQENERKRISREIHDGLGQMLTVVSKNLESLNAKELNLKERKLKIDLVNEMISEIIQESRRISHNLSPVGLYEFGLNPIILQLIKRINFNFEGILVNYTSNLKETRFKLNIEINLYRIIQEVIQNSLKHAECNAIDISINYKNGILKLIMQDNGIGFNLNQIENGKQHFNGIKNIEERAKIIDAEINVVTALGKGYRFELNVKLKKEKHG